ncbi:unnamed protein product [Clonostachys rosea f. rosea IK726]|uniref:FAD-binding PCMH-type domain-containing protein n=2 Tax=Bionectria ochroleuca TaxID=29856 RepID=A0A0B7KD49_BIOOC|nr:unnamed protein product [Clonostachys rosea f. rosea IK726]
MRVSTFASLAALLLSGATEGCAIAVSCRCMPGDSCWPTTNEWNTFNATVGGNLIATVPIGSPCHDPTYDEAACTALQNSWTSPMTHLYHPSSFMQNYFTNRSCDPFTDRATPCELGNYVSFAVAVQNKQHVVSTVKFAREHNIRLVVKHTGHDYFGRSTGAGGLSIFTQGLGGISFSTFKDKYYSGRSMTIGAGVIGYDILKAADENNAVVVTGESATVGLAGGYTQGGGHSALSTAFGLAADQTLSFEVVTAKGEIVTASRTKNEDLYWALSGGGGGNYGVVTSMTVRAHDNLKVGGASFILYPTLLPADQYKQAVETLFSYLPKFADQGVMIVFAIRSNYLAVRNFMIYNSTAERAEEILAPFVADLKTIGITLNPTYSTLSYYDHYATYMGPIPAGILPIGDTQVGGQLLPKTVLETNPKAYANTILEIVSAGGGVIFSVADYSPPDDKVSNSVLPQWRTAVSQVNVLATYDPKGTVEAMETALSTITNTYMPKLKAAVPDSYAYVNEADIQEANWQKTFYGSNYAKLQAIKLKYDCEGLFYTYKGVGSEKWATSTTGRLCATR